MANAKKLTEGVSRISKHTAAVGKILKLDDSRLSGDLRVLVELVALWLDAEGTDKLLFGDILSATFGKRLRYKNPNEQPDPPADSQLESDTRRLIKEALALSQEESNAVPTS